MGMIWYILSGGVALYGVVYMLSPKGSLVHEMLYFPFYIVRHLLSRKPQMTEKRHAYGAHPEQYYLYMEPPAHIPSKNTIVVYFHGGSWRYGRPWLFRVNAGFFALKGYHVLLPSHRRPPRFKYDAIREDLDLLLMSLKQLMLKKNWTKYKILLAGMSSGGHLASMILLDNKSLQKTGFDQTDFLGLLVSGAPLNFNLLIDHPILRDFAGPRSGELFQIANPINYLNKELKVPVLCLHGQKDAMVPLPSIMPFLEEAKHLNYNLTFHCINNGNHMSATRYIYQRGAEREVVEKWLQKLE